MKKLINVPTLLLFIAIVSTAVVAQDTGPAKSKRYASAGIVEFSGTLGFSSTFARYSSSNSSSSSSTPAISQITISPTVSYFITNGLNLGVTGSLVSQFGTGAGSTAYIAYLQPGYAFDVGTIVFPYVNVLFGFGGVSSGSTASGIGYGADAGIKIQLAEHLLLGIGLQYVVQNYSYSGSTYNTAINTFATGISFSYWF